MPRDPRSYEVEALARGLQVLSVFSEQRRKLRVTDIARLTALPVPTVFRLVKTLQASGYLDMLADGEFRPGAQILTLGFAALQGLELVDVASGALKQLASQTGETVNLGVLRGTEVLYLIRIRNTDLVTANIHVGSLLPAACTSMGKLLLAFLPADDLRQLLLKQDLPACRGPNAIHNRTALVAHLKRIHSDGWALNDEELAYGLRSIAGPVRAQGGDVVAAINVAVQATRWTSDALVKNFLPQLLECCADVSRRLGPR